MDVRVGERVHLSALDVTHPTRGREHEDADPVLAAEGVLGGRARVTAGRPEDVEDEAPLPQDVRNGLTEELHRQVLEGHRRAFRQPDEHKAVGHLVETRERDRRRRKAVLPVGGAGELEKIVVGDVGGEQTDDRRCQLGIRQRAQLLERGGVEGRQLRRNSQTAVGCEPREQDVAEADRFHAAARRDELHEPAFVEVVGYA